MAITKTKFLEYTRCPRYPFLAKINQEILAKPMSYEEYQKEQEKVELKELLDAMFETDENGLLVDQTKKTDLKLQAMLPFYKQVEIEAGRIAKEKFGGKTIYHEETKKQVSFSFQYEDIPFLCYIDIYNETETEINIIEVKATTSKKYRELKSGYPKKWKHSIFKKINNIYTLKEETKIDIEKEMPLENYKKEREKLKDRYALGGYVYDLAIQRFIIERSPLKTEKKINYFLAVLNDEYTFNGKYQNDLPIYEKDESGNELITFINLNQITAEMEPMIEKDAKQLLENLKNPKEQEVHLSTSCGYKKVNTCPFFSTVCGKNIPKTNSCLTYINNSFGFLKEDKTRIKGLDLINEGYLDLLDIPEKWITKENHKIQRECYKNHTVFLQKEKISAALDSLEYPIYHLDFETFPSPIPRFKGEHPYTQSPFEFSLHIEREPGVCDKIKDNVVFLAKTMQDERLELIKTLLANVDPNKGTLFAQNVAFEKGRLKELATIFEEYKEPLLALASRGFDLLWIVNNNKEFYEKKGFSKKEVETFNFYDERLSGSFSIKKTLPVFSNLSYKDLEIQNGTEALITYANYKKMTKEEFQKQTEALKKYCAQDTWAMVEILNSLRKMIQQMSKSRQKIRI